MYGFYNFGAKIDFKRKRNENSLSDIKENYYCQFWFKFALILIMLMLSCFLLHSHKEEEDEEEEATTEAVLYKESNLLLIFK